MRWGGTHSRRNERKAARPRGATRAPVRRTTAAAQRFAERPDPQNRLDEEPHGERMPAEALTLAQQTLADSQCA